jgi:acetyl esterase/lipase
MKQSFTTLLFGLCILTSIPAFAQIAPTESDIPYLDAEQAELTEYQEERCLLDIYTPEDVENFPVIVWFHGGGLTGGDKGSSTARVAAERFTNAGIGFVSANYRLSPRAEYPTYIEDAADAIAWTYRNIAPRGGDPERLFVSGHSAGGYLAAIVAMDPAYLERSDLTPEALRGILPVSGQMDTHWTVKRERGISQDVQVIDNAAPIQHAGEAPAPILLLCGDNDLPKRVEVNQQFLDAMNDAGETHIRLVVYEDRNHTSLVNRMLEEDDLVSRDMIQFIRNLSE